MIVLVDSSMLIPLRRASGLHGNHQDFSEDGFPSTPIFEEHRSELQRILNARNVPFPFAWLPPGMRSLPDSKGVEREVEPILEVRYRPATPRRYPGEDLGQQHCAPHLRSGLPFLGTLCYHDRRQPASATAVKLSWLQDKGGLMVPSRINNLIYVTLFTFPV